MCVYNGSLNFFFPCELKPIGEFKEVEKDMKRLYERHSEYCRIHNLPLTEMLDNNNMCIEREHLLSRLSHIFCRESDHNISLFPYATKCLGDEYRYRRENNQHIVNLNVVLSRFTINSCEQEIKNMNPRRLEGMLLLNFNVENQILTAIVVINFEALSSNELVLLKHLFYKRGKVKITEYKPNSIEPRCSCCHEKCFDCIKANNCIEKEFDCSMQEYIHEKTRHIHHLKKKDFDTRARYSLMEIELKHECEESSVNHNLWINQLLNADECIDYCNNNISEYRDKSMRESYQLYLSGKNGLIVTFQDKLRFCVTCHNEFVAKIVKSKEYHISETNRRLCSCIAGVGRNLFAPFLRTVEIDYLMNDALSNEITYRETSYYNPVTIVRRGHKLWKILYELDINKYYFNSSMHKSFGIVHLKDEIKDEYTKLIDRTTAWFMAILSIIMLIASVIQIIIALQ